MVGNMAEYDPIKDILEISRAMSSARAAQDPDVRRNQAAKRRFEATTGMSPERNPGFSAPAGDAQDFQRVFRDGEAQQGDIGLPGSFQEAGERLGAAWRESTPNVNRAMSLMELPGAVFSDAEAMLDRLATPENPTPGQAGGGGRPGSATREVWNALQEGSEPPRTYLDFLTREFPEAPEWARQLGTFGMEVAEPWGVPDVVTPFTAALLRFGKNFKFRRLIDQAAQIDPTAPRRMLQTLESYFDNTLPINPHDPEFADVSVASSSAKKIKAQRRFVNQAKQVDPSLSEDELWNMFSDFESEWKTANQQIRHHYDMLGGNFWNQNADQLNQVQRYTTHEYESINEWLRGGSTPNLNQHLDLENWVKHQDALFARPDARLPEDAVVYRGSAVRPQYLGLPSGTDPSDIRPGDLIGKVLPGDNAYQSYTEALNTGIDFMRTKNFKDMDPNQMFALYQMDAPAGTPAVSLSSIGLEEEAEILLPRGTGMRVNDAEWHQPTRGGPGYWLLDVEPVIPDTPPPTPGFGANARPGTPMSRADLDTAVEQSFEHWASAKGIMDLSTPELQAAADWQDIGQDIPKLWGYDSFIADHMPEDQFDMLTHYVDMIMSDVQTGTIDAAQARGLADDIAPMVKNATGNPLAAKNADVLEERVKLLIDGFANDPSASGGGPNMDDFDDFDAWPFAEDDLPY